MELGKLDQGAFREFLDENLRYHTQTIEALMVLWEVAKNLETQCSGVIKAHEKGKPKKQVASLIREQVSFNVQVYVPTMENVSRAMNADFDQLMIEMAGVLPGGIAMEQAWENFISPVKPIVSEIELWTWVPMSHIATFEDAYLK